MRAILLLAAGQSSRMRGADKLLQDVGGQPLLARIAQQALATGQPTYVTLPPNKPSRSAVLPDGVHQIVVENAADGMGVSIAAGVAALPARITHVMILPSDMPRLETSDFDRLTQASQNHPDKIIRAQSAAHPGHPVVFPKAYFATLTQLSGDQGAKALLKDARADIVYVPLEGNKATLDLDTPEDWAHWRQST